MLLTNRFKFFDKKGYNSNPSPTYAIQVDIVQPETAQYGYGAIINAYSDISGAIVYVEILKSGIGYEPTTYLRFVDIVSNQVFVTDPADITFGVSGEILNFTIPVSKTNTRFTYPSVYYFTQQYLEPVSIGLIATDQIFLLENVFNTNGQSEYVFPRIDEYGPFNIVEYAANGTSGYVKIETTPISGNVFPSGKNIITSVLPSIVSTLKVGMYVTGTGVPANTFIKQIDTVYGLLYLNNDLTVTGAVNVTIYSPHDIRIGNVIRVYDSVGTTPLEGEYTVTTVTATNIYFSTSQIIPPTATTTVCYGVIPIFQASIESGSDPEFFFFDVNYNEDYPTIVKQTSTLFTFDNASMATTPDTLPTGNSLYQRTVSGRLTKEAFQLNIGLQADYEGVYAATILISDITYPETRTIVRYLYEGTTVSEDERLGALLENFGRDVTAEQELILRESDVNEGLTDYILLNQKRKEMLLQGEEIWPYVGAYKGLVNIINWFGYYDVRIKEYWLNVNQEDEYFGKYRQMQIPFQLKDKGKSSDAITLLPSKHYRKTNLFGLFYDLVRDGGTFDVNGIPETVDAFEYTNEEILIKLFALKRYLKEKFLPLNTRIVDITGEGVYYERYTVNSWNNFDQRLNVDLTRQIDFTTNGQQLQIVDVRPFDAGSSLLSPPYYDILGNYFSRYNIDRVLISNAGGPYYGVIPTIAFPGQANQLARGQVRMKGAPIGIIAPLVATGTGYQPGDIITLAGGVYENPLRVTVNLVGPNGEVINFGIDAGPNQGSNYASFPPEFYQANVVSPSGSQYITTSANGFRLNPTDIPFIAESVVLYDKGLQYSNQPTAVFVPAIGGIAATLDITTIPGSPLIYFNDGAAIEPYIDSPNVPVGAPLEMSTSFDITWDEVPYRWQDLGGGSDATLLGWIDPLPTGTGQLLAIEIISQGEGYRYPPTLTVSGGGGFGGAGITELKNGKLKILEYTVSAIGSSLGTNDVLTLSPAMPLGGVNAISTGRIVKGPGIPDGTIINISNQPFSEIELLKYDGTPITTSINVGDKIYIHQGASVTVNGGGYETIPNVAPNGGHVGTLYTWDELGRGDMYQMEWVVSLSSGAEFGQVFNYRSGIGTIDSLITHEVILPYAGKYTIELIVYDTDNNFINEIKVDYITAFLPEATFAYAVKYISDCADTWEEFYQEPIPEFEPTPGMLSPVPPEGIRYTWENAGGRWVNPVFTDTKWDDVDINWGTLEIGNISSVNNYNFPPVINFPIFAVSAEDNSEGGVISYTDTTTTPSSLNPRITLQGQRQYPQIEPTINPNDWIFIRRGEVIYQLEILSSDYTTPGVTILDLVTVPPAAFRNNPTTWEVLREIAGTIVISGNQIYDPVTNPNGFRIGEWLRVFGADDIPKRGRVPIKGKDNYTGDPNYVLLNGGGGDSIYYPGGELGKIYKFRGDDIANGNLVWNSTPANSTWVIEPSISNDPLVNDHIGKLYILDADATAGPGCQPAVPTSEIRPGFSIIHLYVELNNVIVYDQQLRTTHAFLDTSTAGHPWDIWNGTPTNYAGVHVIDIVTLDGGKLSGLTAQLNVWSTAGANIWLEYEYAIFPTRTYLGQNSSGDAEIYMDFNMYPASGDFIAATLPDFTLTDTGWFYDHGIATGDYTIQVTNTGQWRNGLGTIITVDDVNFELYRTSTSFQASQRRFDEDSAERRLGTLVQTWENYRPVLWEESCFHTWDTLDNQERIACSFRITGVDQNGSIQFNNDPQFLFQGIVGGMSNGEKWSQALYELRANDNSGLSRFDYQLDGVYGTDLTILNPDLENFTGKLDTYNYPTLIIDVSFPGIAPAASGDTVVSPYTSAAATINTYPFIGPSGNDIEMTNPLPKKVNFIGNITAGSPYIRNVQGLISDNLYVGEIITGVGLPVSPAAPATVLEIVATGGHVKQIKLSVPATVTASQQYYDVEWYTGNNRVDFLLVFQNGNPSITAFAKTPSVDQLGWLLGQNNVLFEDPLNKVSTSICHTYPLKNVANQFGYGIGLVGGFQGGLNEYLLQNRFFQVYQYEGVNPLNFPGGWYPAANLAPQYQFITNDPLPTPPSIDNELEAEAQSNRLPYESAIGGTWRWEDTYVGTKPTRIPSGSVVLLSADASDIAGKTRYNWRIYENETILVEITDSSILWTFPYEGMFTVELEIVDTNGNRKSLQRKNFIEIYEQVN